MNEPVKVEVGQFWKRNPPKRQAVRVERVWEARRNLMDEVLGLGRDGEAVLCARCHPLNGGKPQVMPVSFLEAEFTLQAAQPQSEGTK